MTRTDQRTRIRVNVFPGGFNWGLYVAIDRGLFARRGLDVTRSNGEIDVQGYAAPSETACVIIY